MRRVRDGAHEGCKEGDGAVGTGAVGVRRGDKCEDWEGYCEGATRVQEGFRRDTGTMQKVRGGCGRGAIKGGEEAAEGASNGGCSTSFHKSYFSVFRFLTYLSHCSVPRKTVVSLFLKKSLPQEVRPKKSLSQYVPVSKSPGLKKTQETSRERQISCSFRDERKLLHHSVDMAPKRRINKGECKCTCITGIIKHVLTAVKAGRCQGGWCSSSCSSFARQNRGVHVRSSSCHDILFMKKEQNV